MSDMLNYGEGDTVHVDQWGGGVRVCLVDTHEEDVKNGRPGGTGVVTIGPEAGYGVWWYDDQVSRVQKGS